MDRAFLQARIDATKALIVLAEDGEAAIVSGATQSYSLDDGQSRQSAVKFNLTELRKYIDSLYNRCATLEIRLNGGSTVVVRPGW